MKKNTDDHAGELGVVMREGLQDRGGERAERRHQRKNEQQSEGLGSLPKPLDQKSEQNDGDRNVVDDDAPEQRRLRVGVAVIMARMRNMVVSGMFAQRHSFNESMYAKANHHPPRHGLMRVGIVTVVVAMPVRMVVNMSMARQMRVPVFDALREVIEQNLEEKTAENEEANRCFWLAERLRQKVEDRDGQKIGATESGEQFDTAAFARLKEQHGHRPDRHREKQDQIRHIQSTKSSSAFLVAQPNANHLHHVGK